MYLYTRGQSSGSILIFLTLLIVVCFLIGFVTGQMLTI